MRLVGLSIVLSAFLIGCAKYEKGGPKRKREFNIQTTWSLKTYSRTGTSNGYLDNYKEKYGEDSLFVRTYTDTFGVDHADTGKYYFTDQGDFLRIAETDSFSTLSDDTLLLYKYKIEQLEFDAYRIVFYQNHQTHYLTFEAE